jgi:chemotaxis protein histidine kinase CheA
MLPEQQQKILVYFIEEAKEHLQTLEQGLMNLQTNSRDSDMVNEMFRAAHSIKGGAAMLGFDSIRRTAHRLEDCLKVVKEHPGTVVDQEAEDLFLRGFDTLVDLITQLEQGNLTEEIGQAAFQQAEPVFSLLHQRLTGETVATQPTVPADFSAQVLAILRQMLELIKQGATPERTQQVAALCDRLGSLAPGVATWQTLTQTAQKAVTSARAPLAKMAGPLLSELKQASELIQQGKAQQVAPSATLCQLAGVDPTTVKTASTTATPASPKQITIPVEPREAAKLLVAHFEPAQLTALAKLLVQALKRPA